MATTITTTCPPGVTLPAGVSPAEGCPVSITDFEQLFRNLLIPLLGIGAVIFFIMILVAGFKYLTSGGEAKQIEEAQKTITYGIGGLVLMVVSLLIIRLIETITGAPLSTFRLFVP